MLRWHIPGASFVIAVSILTCNALGIDWKFWLLRGISIARMNAQETTTTTSKPSPQKRTCPPPKNKYDEYLNNLGLRKC
jgi:hypothetical protein